MLAKELNAFPREFSSIFGTSSMGVSQSINKAIESLRNVPKAALVCADDKHFVLV